MVNLRKLPIAEIRKLAGATLTKGRALQLLRERGKTGRHFATHDEVIKYLGTIYAPARVAPLTPTQKEKYEKAVEAKAKAKAKAKPKVAPKKEEEPKVENKLAYFARFYFEVNIPSIPSDKRFAAKKLLWRRRMEDDSTSEEDFINYATLYGYATNPNIAEDRIERLNFIWALRDLTHIYPVNPGNI